MDWSLGSYERTAVGLLPAAATVLDCADLRPGERVLDVGCGTGNGALLAAERGARVTGADPARRLLDVARAAAAARDLQVSFLEGEAAALPLADGAADVVISVFGVVFAPDAQATAAELARVTAARGRVAFSAWIPEGALFEVMRARGQALSAAGSASAPPPFPWHDAAAVDELLGPRGFSVTRTEHTLSFTGSSPRAFLESELHDHPLWLQGRQQLEPRGEWEALPERALAILENANEQPGGLRVSSRYVVVSASRG